VFSKKTESVVNILDSVGKDKLWGQQLAFHRKLVRFLSDIRFLLVTYLTGSYFTKTVPFKPESDQISAMCISSW